MLRILNFEEIQMLSNGVNRLVDLYEKKDPEFSAKVKSWLKKMEQALENNRLPVSGKIGAFRSMIVAAEQGVIPGKIQFAGNPTRKKIRDATAIHVGLYDALIILNRQLVGAEWS